MVVPMSYCLNPNCPHPQNPKANKFCQSCGAKLLLAERYRAIKLIGEGGFGRTLLAEDEYKPSKPWCVIKQFYPQGQNNARKAAELFHQEAQRLEELGKHPQIPELFAHFEQGDRLYIVQEFIDGQDLAQELAEKGAFQESQIESILSDLLPVLQFIHAGEVIHRDIKPENIIRRRSDDRLVLVDFGAAKYGNAAVLAKTGTTIGSAGYAAPEQAFGKAVFASDIYSLGVTCIHLLTQMEPFDLYDPSESTFVWRHYLINNPLSNKLAGILDKMTQSAVKQRYQSALEVMQDLLKSETPTLGSASQNPSETSSHSKRTLLQVSNTIKTFSKKVSTNVSAAMVLDWTSFRLRYEDCIELYAPVATVAEYVTQHPTWFPRCAHPMKVSPMGANGYDLLLGRYGAFNFEVEARIGLELLPPDPQGVYRIRSITLPNYSPRGYRVDFDGSFRLKEVPVDPSTLEFKALPDINMAHIPSVMTRWEYKLDLEVEIEFPKFIRDMPKWLVKITSDRIILQIVREVSRRLNNKVQTDFHTALGIPFSKKTQKK